MTDYFNENNPQFHYPFDGIGDEGYDMPPGGINVHDGLQPDTLVDPELISEEMADASRLVAVEWPLLTLSELPVTGESTLEPYQVVQGIKSLQDFSKVEEHIVSAVTPAKHDSLAHAMALEPEIITRHIGDVLRPRVGDRKFYGALLQGQVLLLPFDHIHALEYQPELARKALSPDAMEKHPPTGLTVIYNGIFRSSRAGELGEFAVRTSYFNKKSHLRFTRKDGNDYVHRTIGDTSDIHEISYALDQDALESAQVALQITQRSLALRLGCFGAWRSGERKHRP